MPEINPTRATTPAASTSSESSNSSNTTVNAPQSLGEMYNEFSKDGWNDGELKQYISGVIDTGDVQPHLNGIWNAVLSPSLPHEPHSDPKFFEVLAWYIDKSTTQRGDGKLTLDDVQESLNKYGNQYLQLSQDPSQTVARLQAWKFVQKLRLLEREIEVRVAAGQGAYYPYSAREMMEIDGSTDFNRENTLQNRASFDEKVIEASYDKPVLVKFGLTYCAHCLLLEQLGSVPAVAEKYEDQMDVFKIWWNPHDADYADLNQIAREQGVTSSPIFILFKDGEAVKSGYGFPDEQGNGLEGFLEGQL